jgi:hypothetical protein
MIEGAAINKTLSNNLANIDLSYGQISSKLVAFFQRYDRSKMYNLNEMPCINGKPVAGYVHKIKSTKIKYQI